MRGAETGILKGNGGFLAKSEEDIQVFFSKRLI